MRSREFLRRSLLRGEFPFWDPYVGGGSPSFASLVPAYLFPPLLLVVLLGNGSLIANVYILLLILCAGVLTYFLLRKHALCWQAALAGAIAFSFSGAVVQTAPGLFGQPVALFSLPLLVTVRLIALPCARRAAQLALAFAFVALATFPPILLQIFGMCVVYVVVAILLKPGSRVSTAAWFAAGAAVSLAMVGLAYLPGVKLMAETTQIKERYTHAAEEIMPPERLGQALSPSIMGGAAVYAHPAVMRHTGRHLYYSGVVALFLAGVGLFAGCTSDARILRITAPLFSALALAKILGVPPLQWVAHVPFLRDIHYAAYFGIGVAYSAALLAALGVDALLNGRARLWHLAASGSLLAFALLTVRVYAWRHGVSVHPEGWRWIADFRLLVVFAVVAMVVAWVALRSPGMRTLAVTLVVTILATEGVNNSVYPRPHRWDTWMHPPRYVELLAERNSGGRVLPMPLFPANTESVFQQPTLDVVLTASPRMYSLYKHYFGPISDVILRGTTRIPPERVLDVANIEYLAIASADSNRVAEGVQRGYETLYADDLVHLMRRQTDPRYSFTSKYQVAGSESEALAALGTLPGGTVLLDKPASFSPATSETSDVHPRVARFALNDVEIEVRTPRAGLLVCSESNMSGWTATVDGRPAPIVAANYAFRAVEVRPGAHRIRFRYDPPGWTGGLIASGIGLVVCGLGLARRWR